MSGGHFDYLYSTVQDRLFNTWGDDEQNRRLALHKNPFHDLEITEMVFDLCKLLYELEWYESGDTDEDDYEEERKKFRQKWLDGKRSVRTKRTIDTAINAAREDLYRTFGINTEQEDD